MNDFGEYQSAVATLKRRGGSQLQQKRGPVTSRDMPTKSEHCASYQLDGLKPSSSDERKRDSFRRIRCKVGQFRGWTSVVPAKGRRLESFKSLALILTALSRQDGIELGTTIRFNQSDERLSRTSRRRRLEQGGEIQ